MRRTSSSSVARLVEHRDDDRELRRARSRLVLGGRLGPGEDVCLRHGSRSLAVLPRPYGGRVGAADSPGVEARRSSGEPIVRREVWHGEVMLGWGGIVVRDDDDLLVLYMPEHAPLAFTDRDHWRRPPSVERARPLAGHGVLQLQRPGDMHAVWRLLARAGAASSRAWYVNLQEPFRRTAIGFDTQDLELDLVVSRRRLVALQGRRAPRPLGRARPLDGRARSATIRAEGSAPRRRARRRPALVERRLGRVAPRPGLADPRRCRRGRVAGGTEQRDCR